MSYFMIVTILFASMLFYFKIANRYNIIDKPNERSSHNDLTLRGGGIIFFIAVSVYFIFYGLQYPWFFLGLIMITIVSFLDDVFTISNRKRLLVHFIAVVLMAYELQLFLMPWYFLLIGFVIVVGVINAYNFMDGINGITACYSLAIGGLLIMVNQQIGFISQDFLNCVMLGILVFGFFNFRVKAKCFAGDVGAVGIAYILLFVLGLLILKTGNLIYILFLTVYGLDAIWTIVRRLYLRENIFEAHRSHLYQYLGNEAGVNKLLISLLYGVIQFAIGYLVLLVVNEDFDVQLIFTVVLLLILSLLYLICKTYIIKRFVK